MSSRPKKALKVNVAQRVTPASWGLLEKGALLVFQGSAGRVNQERKAVRDSQAVPELQDDLVTMETIDANPTVQFLQRFTERLAL